MRGLLALVSPLDPVANARVDVTVGVSLNSRTLSLGGLTWQTAIIKAPRLTQELVDEDITGSLQLGSGDMTLTASRLKGIANVAKLIWPGSPITIWSGTGPQWADMRLEFSGTVTGGVQNKTNGQIPLTFAVDKKLVDVPLLNQEYGGGGGADGETEVRGQLKPAAFGSPINVPVFFFNQTLWIGQVDAYGNTTALNLLYEDGASFGAKFADYASYALLYAAANAGTIPAGGWATCVAEGMIALGAPPKGVITADPVCGAGTPGTLGLRWLTAHAGVSSGRIDEASFASLDDELEALLGHVPPVSYWTQSQANVLERLQMLASSCNATMLLRLDGQLAISRVFGGAVELSLSRHSGHPRVTAWQTLDPTTPWWRLKISAERTWRVHTEAEIDYENDIVDLGDYDDTAEYRQGNVVRGTDGFRYLYINDVATTGNDPPNVVYWSVYEDPVDASTVKYADGTPVEALKPGEAGANVTGTHQAASIAAQGALATLSQVALGSSGRVYRDDGTTRLTDALAVTSLGTAAAILSQGTFATLSAISSTLANTNNLLRYTSGGLFSGELTADQTSTHTASAISGQGALATLSAAAWGSQVSGRPVELTDGRVATGLTATTGLLQTGIYAGAGSLTIAQMVNTTAGTQLAINPEFQGGVATGWAVYNNAGGTKVTQAIVPDATAPNASGYILRVSYDGTGIANTNPNPEFGGTDPDITVSSTGISYPGFYAKGTQVLQRVWAKIPVGRTLNFTGNAIGTGGTLVALTSMAGTGAYALYVNLATIGTAGSFSNFGHIYISGGANAAFTWDIAKYDMLDLTSAPRVFMGRGGLFDENGVPRFRADLLTSDGTAAAIAGQGAFATLSAISSTLADTNNLLRRTAGGLFSGELAADVTSTHTASAIASQGALATLGQVNLGSSGRVYRDDGTTRLTDALAVTSLGTAAAIISQGALAVLSTVSIGSSGRLLREDGSTYVTDASAITALGTAAAIAGQGALATLNRVGAATIAAGVIGESLIINGGAEEGTTAGWSVGLAYNSGAGNALTAVTTQQNSGRYSFKINKTLTSDVLDIYSADPIPVTPGKTYLFRWSVKSSAAAGSGFYVRIFQLDAALGFAAVTDLVANIAMSTSWVTSEGTFTVPAGSYFIRVQIISYTNAGPIIYLDDVQMFEQVTYQALSNSAARLGINVVRNDGSTSLTDALAVTSLGTAAAIASQGALATLAQVNLGSSGRVYRDDGTTRLTDALAVTSLGTASAIASQGAFATLSTIAWTSTYILYQPGLVEIVETIAYDSISSTGNRADTGMGLTNPSVCSLVNSSDTNGKMLEIGDNAGDDNCGIFLNQYLAYDGNGTSGSLYELIFDVEHVNVGTGVLYLGLKALDRAGNSLGGSYNYVAATGITPTAGRTLYKAYLQGTGSSAAYHANGSTPSSPQLLPDGSANGFGAGGTVKIAPMGLIHYSGNPGKTRTHGIYLRKISERSRLFGTNGVATNSNMLPANVLYGLIPSLKTAPTLSDTDNSGTVTINIGSAVHVPDAGGTVTFPSGTLAGKAYGTTYYIKRVGVDPISAPTGTGWNASTTLSISVGDVYENYYTTRASGGVPSPPPPPPPGGGGQCVAVDMWLETGSEFRKAGEAAADWPICTLDYGTLASSSTAAIASVEFSYMPCVRIVTESGGAGIFSETTPLTLEDGSSLNILEGAGRMIFVRDRRGGALVERWERIASIEPAGRRQVAHIHAGGATFAAGESEDFMLMTHNYDKP